jgi:organic radical activating enzyme
MGRDYTKKETYREFKIRVIDPISPTYCGAKWYNATIWLGHGQTASCHHPPAHRIDPEEIKTNPSAIHNTQHKKLMRKLMLEGERPNECEYCWKVEDMGRDAVSDRVFKTHIFSDEDIAESTKLPWDHNINLKTLEISFERTCNFACTYCNPAFSTSWVRDIKRNGPYLNIVSDGRGHFIDTAPWAASPSNEDENPYIQAFWKWWESDLADNLEEIRITGGEPLMAPSVWKLFEWFKNNPERGRKMRFAINTNLVPKPEILDRLIELSHDIPHLEIYTSNESKGAHAEYIRDGMIYDQWFKNLQRLQTEANIKGIHCMMTINSLCLASITEFMDDILKFKLENQTRSPYMSLNIMRFPSFQSAAILPDRMKKFYKEKLQNWLADKVGEDKKVDLGHWKGTILTESEVDQVNRLIDYLDVVKTPHRNTAEQPKLYNDFRSFFEQYDRRRGKNFRETFPRDFVDFIDSIEMLPEEKPIHNGDPATTEAGYISDELAHGWDIENDSLGKNV